MIAYLDLELGSRTYIVTNCFSHRHVAYLVGIGSVRTTGTCVFLDIAECVHLATAIWQFFEKRNNVQ